MNHELIRNMLIAAGKAVRKQVMHSLSQQDIRQLSQVHAEKREDTIFVIDRQVEPILLEVFQKYAHQAGGLILLAEGLDDEGLPVTLPESATPSQAAVQIIVDPIDGTRGLMYNKRPAFFLAGAAPNKGNDTTLADIEVAVMVELPTNKQYQADVISAVKGRGVMAVREDLLTGRSAPLHVAPSQAHTIIGGFAQFARFFPPGREVLSAIEEELIQLLTPAETFSSALVFEDQYISSGGQLYELLMGHDRFTADVRGLLYRKLIKDGKSGGHVCHPYDVCAHLIGNEAGLIITDALGNKLDAPFSLTYEINWAGYANLDIAKQVQPVLNMLLQKYQLI